MTITPYLRALHVQAVADRIPVISAANSLFLATVLQLMSARSVVEIGTAIGYSAMVFTEAMGADGHVVSFEKSADRYGDALTNVAEGGYTDRITLYHGDIWELPENLVPSEVDFVFIDALKRDSLAYLVMMEPYVREGGVIVIDDVIKFADKMSDLYEFVSTYSIPHSILPIDEDDGIMLFHKTSEWSQIFRMAQKPKNLKIRSGIV